MAADYARAAAGLSLTALPLLLFDTAAPVAWVLGTLAVLFGLFALRTTRHHVTRIERDALGLTVHDFRPSRLDWHDLKRLRLAFYAPRRRREQGWMQLTLAAGPTVLRLDSSLSGFDDLVRAASQAALDRRLELDEPTVANLGEFGVALPAHDSWE